MTTISVQSAPMANNDRNTLGRLFKLGVVGRNQTYSLTASQMGECGLAPNQLLPLLKASVAEVRDASGQEIEPKTTVGVGLPHRRGRDPHGGRPDRMRAAARWRLPFNCREWRALGRRQADTSRSLTSAGGLLQS
jgi:hypothetical protein